MADKSKQVEIAMSTVRHILTDGEWTKATNSAAGSIFIERGEVAITQAEALPGSSIVNTPLMGIMSESQSRVYFSIPVGSFIYARSLKGSAKITDTAADSAGA